MSEILLVFQTVEFWTGFLAGALLADVATKGVKRVFKDRVDDVTDDN